jgi:carbon-monoxide dehydrogenase medium subunit
MKPAPFEYHAPRSVDGAVRLLRELGDARLLAGGQSLVPLMALRLAAVEHVVDLGRVDGLRGIERRDGSLWIGAGTTQSAAERDPEVAAAVPLLARALPLVGHFQIRNRGTVGGSLAHADPAAELPAVALALDAQLHATGPTGSRTIAAADFFTGTWDTTLEPDEVLTGVMFPVWEGRCGFAVEEVARRHGDFAVAGACVAVELDGRGDVRRCAIGLLGLGSTPERALAAEALATGAAADVDPVELGRRAVAGLVRVPSDLGGSADHRRHLGEVVVRRAWTRAIEEAQDA